MGNVKKRSLARGNDTPLVSCVCITQPGREPWLFEAIADFSRQTYPKKELVILHDGPTALTVAIEKQARTYPDARIRVLPVPAGQTLGELRNHSHLAARGPLVCQWDDDDRHHPQRIALQYEALVQKNHAACFLVEQLHLFVMDKTLYWVDWGRETYPFNLIPGTLLGWKAHLPLYRALARGEDSTLVLDLLRTGLPLARLAGMGWLYIYRYTGQNTFERAHHDAIVRFKCLTGAGLLVRRPVLEVRMAEYFPPLPAVRVPWQDGEYTIMPPSFRGDV
jgi:glycosyltransferase involved in cell wall biosynthesis